MSNKYKGMINVMEQFVKKLDVYNNPSTVQNIVDSLSSFQYSVNNLNYQKMTENINNTLAKINIQSIKNIEKQVFESYSDLLKNIQFDNFINDYYSKIISNNVYNKEISIDEYANEIVNDLCNNIEPDVIADNLEQKTSISADTWMEFIIAIIMFITTILGLLSDSPIEININKYDIDNLNIELKSDEIIENLEQINENTTNH